MFHNHPSPSIEAAAKKNAPRLIDLDGNRQMELRTAVLTHKRTKALPDICAILNEKVDPQNRRLYIFPQQVKEAREKFIYTKDVKTFEEISMRDDLCQTRSGQRYVYIYMQLPVFIFMLSSDWQINLLRHINTKDQIFIDGTFKVCPLGVTQMVSILVKKTGWREALPVAHTLLKNKEETTYSEMLRFIILLASNDSGCYLRDSNIFITCDFELAFINAINKMLPNAKVIGCKFHMIQAIMRNILKKKFGKTTQEDMESEQNREDLIRRIHKLMDCSSQQLYIQERASFITYYSVKKDYDSFLQYMINNWLGSKDKEAKFSHLLWTQIQLPKDFDLHTTNNLIETFHKNINMKFSSKPGLKRCMQILQDIESDYLTKKEHMENHITVSNYSPSSSSMNVPRSSKKKKASNRDTPSKRKRNDQSQTRSSTSELPNIANNLVMNSVNPAINFPTFGGTIQLPFFNIQNSTVSQTITTNNAGNQDNSVNDRQCNTILQFQPFDDLMLQFFFYFGTINKERNAHNCAVLNLWNEGVQIQLTR
jgi:hypothetical protein